MRGGVVVGALLALVATTSPTTVEAQIAELNRAFALVEAGGLDEARDVVGGWWEANATGGTRQEQELALWLRGLLTIDPDLAERDYRRIVLEFPGSRFADEALVRLAHLSEAREDPEAARRHLEILLRDYPQSPHRVEARARLARLPTDASPPPDVTEAAEVADAPPTEAPPVERLPERPPVDDPPVESSPPLPYAIQLGAFSTLERARSLAEEVRGRGYEVRVVQVEGSALVRVRMGAFPTRPDAEEVARALRGLGLEAVVSSDREREGEVR